MSITISQIPHFPILIITVPEGVDPETFGEALCSLQGVTDHLTGPVYRIFDFSEMVADFSDLVQIMDVTTRPGENGRCEEGPFRDPRFHNIIVSKQELFQVGAAAYGRAHRLDVPFFGTLEEAIAYAREQISLREPIRKPVL
ncbi:MAG TPA: hypothetical protein ENI95_04720 [Chloroflexi bacterium]|nr:hypothetical protein [Chloroflexota bacterium]